MRLEIRKIVIIVDETRAEAAIAAARPLRKVAAAAVIRNPYAASYHEDLSEAIKASSELGTLLGEKAAAALGDPAESHGKGGLVGVAGELEHANMLLTTEFGDAMRQAVGGGKAWIPSTSKRAGPGAVLDVPLAYKDALYVRANYDTVEVRIPDAPLPDEVIVITAYANRGRLNARLGGLTAEEVVGLDGLR